MSLVCYNCYRLSSTATAGLQQPSRSITKAAVFGGIDYDPQLTTLQALHITTREISLFDFSQLDLVVLSACKTGVGEVKDDGVFGLQRAFKKAGAKSLAMSLWSVNDAATERMMTSFNTYLSEGASKHQAFCRAQADLRQSAEFHAPSCWAAFVMLDSQD